MKYAKEVIGLMSAYPGRDWKMANLINEVSQGRTICKQERNRLRFCVAEVLKALESSGSIEVTKQKPLRGSFAFYRWK